MRVKALASSRLSHVERERCLAIALLLNSPNQIEKLVNEDVQWGIKSLSPDGRVAVLLYRGIEVRLFFKRQTIDEPVSDDSPDAQLHSPLNEWLTINLLGVDTVDTKMLRELADAKRLAMHIQRSLDEEHERNLQARAELLDTANALRKSLHEAQEKIKTLTAVKGAKNGKKSTTRKKGKK